MTVKELLYDARALIDEYNEDGVVIPDSDVATIESNGIRFINLAIREIFKYLHETASVTISNRKFTNLLGSQYNVVEFIGTDQYYPSEDGITGALSYFFMADSDFEAYIEEFDGNSWNALVSYNETISDETAYSGAITPSDSDYPIRLRFSGSTYYTHYNRCLYTIRFKSGSIPRYERYIRYSMPSDFGSVNEVIEQARNNDYSIMANYSWEKDNTFVFNSNFEGLIKIFYEPIPTSVTAVTDNVAVTNQLALQFITYYVATHMALTENTDVANFLAQKTDEAKYAAMQDTAPASEEKVQDVYGGWY